MNLWLIWCRIRTGREWESSTCYVMFEVITAATVKSFVYNLTQFSSVDFLPRFSETSVTFIRLSLITLWPYSASELYRPSDSRLSAKLLPNFADRGCRVASATDSYGRILGFLDWSRYYFSQVAPHLYSRGWVDPVPDPQLLRKSGSAVNRTWTSGSVARNSWLLDHRVGRISSDYMT
jgi:hypothetical protein